MTAGDTLVHQAAILVQRLIGLSNVEVVFHVGGHILHVRGNKTSGLVHLPVGSLHEAVFIDLGKGSQIVDQADVGTFGGLNGAHPAIVGVMNVSHVEGGPVTAQTAGAQSGQTPLVSQLGQRVILVHELAQGAGAKELLDDGGDRPNVDQALRGDGVQVLDSHPLPDHPIQTGKADAELVLQQLAYAAQAAVAQVVDVVGGAHAHGHTVQVVNGGHDVVHDDVVGD